MKVRILYFAVVRERLRSDGETIELDGAPTVGALLDALVRRHEPLASLRAALKVAVNRELVGGERVLEDGDEVALIPPVSGGAGGLYRVTDAPLDLSEVVRAVSGPDQGGVVTFTGVVRGESHGKKILRLEYEAYAPMAEAEMAAIGRAIERELPGARVAMAHRVGVLAVDEAAVVIAAAAPHRAAAFDACRAAIDRLKSSVPIWKKEVAEDGEEWLGLGP